MTTWRTRGLRGSDLEDLITTTIEYYRQQKLGRVDKIATPVKVIDIDGNGTITKGFFEKKSTVDFMGIMQGIGIAFDAKETAQKSLPLSNIHDHQVEFMHDIVDQKGLAFIIAHFKHCDCYHLIPYEVLVKYVTIAQQGGRKSIPFKDLDPDFEIKMATNGILNFLPVLNTYLNKKRSGAFD